jgi:hypothetical protein
MKPNILLLTLMILASCHCVASPKIITKNHIISPNLTGHASIGDGYGDVFDFNEHTMAMAGTQSYRQWSLIVFEKKGGNWEEAAFLETSNFVEYDNLALDVKVFGDFIFVSTQIENGAVHVFKKVEGVWAEVQIIKPSNLANDEKFATSIDATENKLIVGTSNLTTTQIANRGVYIFEYDNNQWVETHKLKPSNVSNDNRYEYVVSAEQNQILIGDPLDGFVYLFSFNDISKTWSETQTFTSPWDLSSQFGASLAINNNHVLIGAPNNQFNSPADGVVSSYINESGVYNFHNNIYPNDHVEGDYFGKSISIDGDHVVISRNNDDYNRLRGFYYFKFETNGWQEISFTVSPDFPETSMTFGFNVKILGNQVMTSDPTINMGVAYLFVLENSTIDFYESLKPAFGASGLRFGSHFVADGDKILVENQFISNDGLPHSDTSFLEVEVQSSEIISSIDMGWADAGFSLSERGYVYAMDNNWAAVGNPPGGSTYTPEDGWVKIYEYVISDWIEVTTIQPPAPPFVNISFGSVIGLYDEMLFISDYKEDAASPYMPEAGNVYFYQLENNMWLEKQTIHAIQPSFYGHFGYSTYYNGNLLFVGAPGAIENDVNSGVVHVFENIAGTWHEIQKITPTNQVENMRFGSTVIANETQLIIGANGFSFPRVNASTYYFIKDGNSWIEQQTLVHPDGISPNGFGHSIALVNTDLFISAPFALNDEEVSTGDVSYYTLDENNLWEFEKSIHDSELEKDDLFGDKIAVENNKLLISSPHTDQNGLNSGAIFVYDLKGDLIYKSGFED